MLRGSHALCDWSGWSGWPPGKESAGSYAHPETVVAEARAGMIGKYPGKGLARWGVHISRQKSLLHSDLRSMEKAEDQSQHPHLVVRVREAEVGRL